jgi:C4-dicarboxylate-specific signal transduction histidine kinase
MHGEAQLEHPAEHPADEIKRLQRCINDLVSVLALPAIWTGGEPSQIVSTLLDALLSMLHLDLIYVRLKDPVSEAPIEMVRGAPMSKLALRLTTRRQEIGEALDHWLGDDPQKWPPLARNPIGDEDISIVPLRLGLQSEIGVIVAGSQRADFPGQAERLLLSVAANQASIGLQEARLLSQQKRVAHELDQRVAQRTTELAAANEELRKEIAERRLAEERLRRSEAFLAEGQHLSRTGSFSWHVSTNEITWSEQLYRIFEFEQDAPVTIERIGTRVHPEDLPLVIDMIDRARGASSDFEFEHRLQMPDRSVKYLHMVAHGTRDQDGRLEYIGAIQDVTQRRNSEEALSKARSELAHVARATSLGALTASIAHELNQPLSGIITNASTCLRMLAADPPNVEGARETARRTIRDGNRASEVVTRLRALFSKKDVTTESVDLNEATREVITLSLSRLQRSRVILRPELADDLPPVTGDRVQLQQVILNLFLNALDAMSGVDDRPRRLVIRTERDEGDRVRLAVQDAGVGFEPQGADKLFEPFYTTKIGGMGIGLSVSRSIIESHHGRLWAAPNDGPGATFSFSIPRVPAGVMGAHSNRDIRTPAVTDTDAA